MKIVFGTSNKNKLREIVSMLPESMDLVGLKDIGCHEEVPETSLTIEGNARQKAQYIYDHYGHDCFAEDTGLEVKSLDMRPGVYTARYAGPQRNPVDNMNKVLEELQEEKGREARFKTVIAYIRRGEMFTFEGIINGQIAHEKLGTDGFGYDPIFIPDGETRSFAQMTKDEKNSMSHRARAFKSFLNFLNK